MLIWILSKIYIWIEWKYLLSQSKLLREMIVEDLPEHDDDDNDVAHDAPDHAEDVDTQVETQLRNCWPGVSHGLGGWIIAFCDKTN